MQKAIPFILGGYILIYCIETVVRYLLNLVGADALIFLRDGILLLLVTAVGCAQFMQRRLHPAFIIYLLMIAMHGTIIMLTIGRYEAVLFGAKALLTMLAGAIFAPLLMQPTPRMMGFIFLLWVSVFVGVLLDKYYMEWPWSNMTTVIGGVEVDISRNWQVEGDAKRAGGFFRSSIHAANAAPLLAFMLIFHLRRLWLQIIIAIATLFILFWTTQKGSLLAYAIGLMLIMLAPTRPITPLRWGFGFFLILLVLLPIILPYYYMPEASDGSFNNMSFNLRVEMMWPEAWQWVRKHELFPFGVGLAGISGGQQIYAPSEINAADNMFVYMYACFGIMAFVYLGYMAKLVFRAPSRLSGADGRAHANAVAILFFVVSYGCVLSVPEDQISSLFLGAAMGWLGYASKHKNAHDTAITQLT